MRFRFASQVALTPPGTTERGEHGAALPTPQQTSQCCALLPGAVRLPPMCRDEDMKVFGRWEDTPGWYLWIPPRDDEIDGNEDLSNGKRVNRRIMKKL